MPFVRSLLDRFERCGTPSAAMQAAKRCACGAERPCYIQVFEEVRSALLDVDALRAVRLCPSRKPPLAAVVEAALGFPLSKGQVWLGSALGAVRNPIFGLRPLRDGDEVCAPRATSVCARIY